MLLPILLVIGCALLPRLDIADQPRPRQGKTLSVWYSWHGASAKVVEQNVTSRIEGLVSAVRGVENVKSESYFGSGRVTIELKKNADVSATKFEIASLLRQVRKQLPEGVSYPELSGGEVVNENESHRKETTQVLLSYRVNSNLSDEQLKEYIERQVEPAIRQIEEVKRVEVTGERNKYIVITYDPFILRSYGLSAGDIENGIRAFLGRCEVIGTAPLQIAPGGERLPGRGEKSGERHTLYLTTEKFDKPLEQMPIGQISSPSMEDGRGLTVYLNDLATYEYKDRLPDSYFRINGLNTIYLNIHVDADANKIALSKTLRRKLAEVESHLRQGVYLTLTHDAAEAQESELGKLLWRSSLSLFILLAFVWLVRRDWRYLLVMALTLAANLALAVIAYYIFDIRLHIYSLAGITVSFGMVIDAAVVMVDHYSYYRDRKVFLAILAALLTTIGSLIVVLWLPDFLQKDLYDFAWIIIINLSAALVVSWLFAPALIDWIAPTTSPKGEGSVRFALAWGRSYARYIRFTQKRKWVYCLIVVMLFGIPFHLLPSKWGGDNNHYFGIPANDTVPKPWYEQAYNATLGSTFFQRDCKAPLSLLFGGTMRLFSESLSSNTYGHREEREKRLIIRAQMPLGGTAAQLNEKVVMLENFLARFPEIERFETNIAGWGASVTVDFKPEYKHSAFPYLLENKVIGKVISIGGADWSTSGVSERGFSNSLFLQYRSNHIDIAGYNYERLYRIAEDMCDEMRKNNRVLDLTIETPRYENQEDELFMSYDKEKMALYDIDLAKAHSALREVLSGRELYHRTPSEGSKAREGILSADMYLKSSWQDRFDVWHLQNYDIFSPLAGTGGSWSIQRREAKNCIPRENQEYVLRVSFNIIGSYTYTSNYIKRITEELNAKMPVGFKCKNTSYGYYDDNGTQYWLLGLIVVIIFFVCSILFESLRLPLAIISLIPVSFIGTFLTYWLTGVDFGTGGFASMVLLSGLTVNAGIYILCEYNNQREAYPAVTALKCYLRAYNHKVTAVFLTTLSTVLGLVPFFFDASSTGQNYMDGARDSFWFSFAVGSTGGLLFSILALVFVMPICLRFQAVRPK